MILQFKNAYPEKLFEGKPIPGKPRYSNEVVTKFKKTVLKLQYADSIRELRAHKGLNFEALKGDWKGYFSVRVDYSYRLILTVANDETIKSLKFLPSITLQTTIGSLNRI
jgi:proteic killer suppression protein